MDFNRSKQLLCAVLLTGLLGGCSPLHVACAPPARMMASAEMIFGRNIGTRVGVSEAEFGSFVTKIVAPRFPDGFTVLDARGRWRDEKGAVITEPSKVVLITFADDPSKRADLVVIADEYKQRFAQQSVLTQVRNVCASF